MTFKEKLIEKNAPTKLIEWVGEKTFEEVWTTCPRAVWMDCMIQTFELCDEQELISIELAAADAAIGVVEAKFVEDNSERYFFLFIAVVSGLASIFYQAEQVLLCSIFIVAGAVAIVLVSAVAVHQEEIAAESADIYRNHLPFAVIKNKMYEY